MENSCLQSKATVYEQFPAEMGLPGMAKEVRKGAKERMVRQKNELRQKRCAERPIVSTVYRMVEPKPVPSHGRPCDPHAHTGQIILNRDLLDPAEHLNLIASPKEKQVSIPRHPEILSSTPVSLTNRVKALARPRKVHVKSTLDSFSTRLSLPQKERLEDLLQPQGYVSILEALGYAKQQRRDDANLRRYRIKRQEQRIRQMRQMELRCLHEKLSKLIKELKPYYLHGEPFPLEDDIVPIVEAVRFRVYEFLNTSVPETTMRKKEDRDVIDDFFIEFSEKVGRWIRELLRSHQLSERVSETVSASLVSVNTSEFEMQQAAEESGALRQASCEPIENVESEIKPSSDTVLVTGDDEAGENNTTRSNVSVFEDGETTMVQDTQLDETEMEDIEGENVEEDQERTLVP